MQAETEEKKKILGFASNFSEIAARERWISHYDSDSDSLAIRAPELSDDARKKYFNDEFAFYVSKNNDVQGVFIEYFASNFLSHHGNLKNIAGKLQAKHEKGTVIELQAKEVRKVLPILESVIINAMITTPSNGETKAIA